jgi:hypothetical protein
VTKDAAKGYSPRQADKARKVMLPIVGETSYEKMLSMGMYHSQPGDCVHWLAPGPIDFMAQDVMEWMDQQIGNSTI